VQNHKPVCQHKLSHLIKALLFQVKPVNDLLVTKSNNGLKFYSKSIFPKLITPLAQVFPLVQNHKPVCQHKVSHLIKALLFQVKPVNDLLVTKSNNGSKFYSKSIFPKLITQVSQLLYNIDIPRFVI
jgi:hypothetical protein